MITNYDSLLRPKTLSQVIGQSEAKTLLDTVIRAAKVQRQPVGHVLLTGGAGLGKTTLAHVIANEMQAPLWATTGTNLATQLQDYKALFEEIIPTIEQGGVIFVDEIHRVANLVQDTLLPLLERNWLAIRYRAPHAGYGFRKGDWMAYSTQVKPFTFVGATTRSSLLQDPFRGRFKLELQLEFYDNESMFQIVRRSTWLLEAGISDAALRIVAQRSKGVPRVGNNFVWYAQQWGIANQRYVDVPQMETVMAELGIDTLGLNRKDRKLLSYLIELDRPVGVNTIAAYLAEDARTVEEVIEPSLIRAELIVRGPRGRSASEKAKSHILKGEP